MKPRTFQQVRDILDEIDCINSGGCGVSALALHRWRVAHQLRDVGSFVLLYRDEEDLCANERAMENNEYDCMIVPSHVMLRVNSKLYDSTGGYNPDDYRHYVIQTGINETILLHLLNDCRDGWNSWFDRDYALDEITERTGIDLSDIER